MHGPVLFPLQPLLPDQPQKQQQHQAAPGSTPLPNGRPGQFQQRRAGSRASHHRAAVCLTPVLSVPYCRCRCPLAPAAALSCSATST